LLSNGWDFPVELVDLPFWIGGVGKDFYDGTSLRLGGSSGEGV
jgi:hypothetical protein